jgi:hypothetical protein
MTRAQQGQLLGQEQALALIEALDDPLTKRLVERQVSAAMKLVLAGTRPCSDFDMVFLARCAIAFAGQPQAIRALLDGREPDGIPG